MNDRNKHILESIERYTQEMINDPVRLAAWAEKQMESRQQYEEYMALEIHDNNCYCSRCMTDFNEHLRNKNRSE